MALDDDAFDLEGKRTTAKITQAEMAGFLGVSQSQVSRYELDPENVPAGVLRKWHQVCGEMSAGKGVEMGDPRTELNDRLALMQSYAEVEPAHAEENTPVRAGEFLAGVREIAKKPRVGIAGRFDAGKSRLINTILGGDRLPTGYQPATSVVCLIRHKSDKPSWQAEDVLIMGKGFDLSRADDREYCLGDGGANVGYKMFAGGYEALKQFGTHTGSGSVHKAYAAIVYVDSPILTGADLVDLPGYGHSTDDHDRAEMAQKFVDVLVYASPTTGFLDQQDLTYLSVLLRNLPVLPETNGLHPLRNVFILATHAHHQSREENRLVIHAAALRAFRHLENVVKERGEQAGVDLAPAALGARCFTFTADDPARREAFVNDLLELIGSLYPRWTFQRVQQHVIKAKSEATSVCDAWLHRLKTALDERERAQAEIKAIKAVEGERLRKKAAHEQTVNDLITHLANRSEQQVHTVFGEMATVTAIEAMIRRRYDDKKEAQQLAASYLVEQIQKGVNDSIKVMANELATKIEDFMNDYGPAVDHSKLTSSGWDFNPRVAFMGALSGLGTIGALAAWASIAAAGSNLGAYVLIAQIVGWLSSIGISLGGSAAVISFVAAIGGPITLGVVAAVAVAALFASIFGDAWQTKLAKKIDDKLRTERIENKISTGVAKYWADTKTSFGLAVQKTEDAYLEKLNALETIAFSMEPAEIERQIRFAQETRDFFAGMPWRATPT